LAIARETLAYSKEADMKDLRHPVMMFKSRAEAGRLLAEMLRSYSERENVLVLAVPCGGVPVAVEVANALDLPLDVLVAQRVVASCHEPWQQELSLGAVARGGACALNPEIIQNCGIVRQQVEAAVARSRRELNRRDALYRGECPFPNIGKHTIILVDDGIKTGATLRASIQALRILGAARIVVAVPVGSMQACEELGHLADEVICPVQDQPFGNIHGRYRDFPRITDEQVRTLIDLNPRRTAAGR